MNYPNKSTDAHGAALATPIAQEIRRELLNCEPEAIPDERLVLMAQSGELEAFRALILRYERLVYGLARRITQDSSDADDVLQNVFFSVFRHLRDFEGKARFQTWLTRITINESILWLRRGQRRKALSLSGPEDPREPVPEIPSREESPERLHARTELRSILLGAISSLPRDYRIVFRLRTIDELSTEETARLLNMKKSAVKTRLLRARLLLRGKHAAWERTARKGESD